MTQKQSKISQIPNFISLSRIIFSLLLFFIFSNPVLFLFFYLLAGITDMLDGYLARKLRSESEFGARLDSVGDFIMFAALAAYLYQIQKNIVIAYLVPVLIIFIVRMVNMVIGFFKFRKMVFIHTIGNKITGFLVYILTVVIIFKFNTFLLITTIVAFLSAVEETVIILKSSVTEVDPNKKSLFSKQVNHTPRSFSK